MLVIVQYFHPDKPNRKEFDKTITAFSTITNVKSIKQAHNFMENTKEIWPNGQLIGYMIYDPADPKTLKRPLFCNVSQETRKAVGY